MSRGRGDFVIKLDYEISEKDYINFKIYHMSNLKSTKIANIICFVFLSLFLFVEPFLTLLNDPGVEHKWAAFIILLLAALTGSFVLVYLLYKFSMKINLKKHLKSGKHNDFVGSQTIVLHDEFIEGFDKYSSSKASYAAVEKICFAFNYFFIYIGAIKAIIVPLSAFSGDGQKKDFLDFLKQKTGLDVLVRKRDVKNFRGGF